MIEEDIYMIQSYMDRELEPGEIDKFRARLETELELRELLITYQRIERTMMKEAVNDGALRHTLQQMNKKYFVDSNYKRSPKL